MGNVSGNRLDNNRKYYAERFARFGTEDVRALGWVSAESQRIRFKVLTEIADLEGRSVLDFGCGFGDLYRYLQERNIETQYEGCDEFPEMLSVAAQKHGAQFTTYPTAPAYDYVLVSGTFNLDPAGLSRIIDLWPLARRGMAVNFTSALAEQQDPEIHYVEPTHAVLMASRITKNFVCRHDYKPNDLTLYLYR